MKKYLLSFVLILSFTNLFAQHISFLGIQLGQSEKVFDRLIRQKGFTHLTLNGEILHDAYKGTFWRYQDSRLYIGVEDGKVYSVAVWPPYECNRMSDYENLVNNLDKKYGSHYLITDVFKYDSFLSKNDGGACWKVSGGYIATYYVYNPSNRNKIVFRIHYIDNSDKRVLLEKGRKRNTDNDL